VARICESQQVNVLAIETSAAVGGVALVRDREILRELSFERGMEHGRMLVARLDEACAAEGWSPARDVDIVAVSQGPGSFTGLRVGIACAKGIAFAGRAKLVGVCSFDVIARNAPEEAENLCVTLDARRGDVFYAVYQRENGEWVRLRGPEVGRPDDAASSTARPAWILGDGARAFPEIFGAHGLQTAPEELWVARAGVVGLLGERLARQGRFSEVRELAPIYLRRPEAEEKRLAQERDRSIE